MHGFVTFRAVRFAFRSLSTDNGIMNLGSGQTQACFGRVGQNSNRPLLGFHRQGVKIDSSPSGEPVRGSITPVFSLP